VDAFESGVWDLSECEARGFCWAEPPVNVPDVPWCYFPAASEMGVGDCDASAAARRDCTSHSGEYDEANCVSMGCCWRPSEADEPWCYLPEGEGIPSHDEL